ncbi:unnamed protein product [Meloidogyne enterolobii]|uniref:Uncharacterized protein n=1 Tax=Meloidogyne enterolobii TaxID=390850 RepID=A0ACB0Y7F9_MELEN
MEINPNNIIGLLSQVFPDSNNKTPVNSTERKLAQSLAAAINNWKEADEVGEEVLEEAAENVKEELLSIEDELAEESTGQEETTEREDSGDINDSVGEINDQKCDDSRQVLDETASLNENNEEDDSLSIEGNLSQISTNQDEPNENRENVGIFSSFETMGLKTELLRGIYSYGFEKPAAVQQRVIKQIIIGRDVIAVSPPGTGKTAGFIIGLLQSIIYDARETQALVLAHTRDNAVNIQKTILAIGDYFNVQCHACVGGTNIHEDRRKLDYGQHVVTGTPGRILDMIYRRNLRTRSIKLLIIDEADQILKSQLKHQINDIYRVIQPNVQVIFVCSKLTPDLEEMANKMMIDSVRIALKSELKNVHFYINTNPKESKHEILGDFIETMMRVTPVIFCNTITTLNFLKEKMGGEIKNCFCLHSLLKRKEKFEILNNFRSSSKERFGCKIFKSMHERLDGVRNMSCKSVDYPHNFSSFPSFRGDQGFEIFFITHLIFCQQVVFHFLKTC